MSNIKPDPGVAFGLFAIFAMLRYGTDPLPILEMTYLFVVMGLSVINALSNKKVSYAELLFKIFAIVIFITYSNGMDATTRSMNQRLSKRGLCCAKRKYSYRPSNI